MSPPLSKTASHLSDHQLFHQAALILEATLAGMSNRKGALPLKLPRSQPVGPPEAHVLPVEARVPPKPHGSLGNPSSSNASPSQAKYSPEPPGQLWPVHLGTLSMASLLKHAHYIAKLSMP